MRPPQGRSTGAVPTPPATSVRYAVRYEDGHNAPMEYLFESWAELEARLGPEVAAGLADPEEYEYRDCQDVYTILEPGDLRLHAEYLRRLADWIQGGERP